MNKKIKDLLLSLAFMGDYNYGSYYWYDSKVNECLINMYFYMMHHDKNKKEEFFEEFEKSFNVLNDEQKEIVIKDYNEIIETQNKNMEKEKIKKKGNDKYE